jgi:hypothetical protein
MLSDLLSPVSSDTFCSTQDAGAIRLTVTRWWNRCPGLLELPGKGVPQAARPQRWRPALGDQAEETAFFEDAAGGTVGGDAQGLRRVPGAADLLARPGPRPPAGHCAPVGVPGEDAGQLQDGLAGVGPQRGDDRVSDDGAEVGTLAAGTLRPAWDCLDSRRAEPGPEQPRDHRKRLPAPARARRSAGRYPPIRPRYTESVRGPLTGHHPTDLACTGHQRERRLNRPVR